MSSLFQPLNTFNNFENGDIAATCTCMFISTHYFKTLTKNVMKFVLVW